MNTNLAWIIPALLIGMVGCDVTTEITIAPFELTSGLVRGTTDFTSSTSPGATALTGHAKARQQLELFTAYSYENVRADIARGRGEYLVSLATLAGVPASSQAAFQGAMQNDYASLYDPTVPTKESWMRVVNTAWSAGYGHSAFTE